MRIGRKQLLPGGEWGATRQDAAKKLVFETCCYMSYLREQTISVSATGTTQSYVVEIQN